METFDFTIIVDVGTTDDEDKQLIVNALYEAGCDDTLVSWRGEDNRIHIDFSREAPSLITAVLSARRDIAKTGLKEVGYTGPRRKDVKSNDT